MHEQISERAPRPQRLAPWSALFPLALAVGILASPNVAAADEGVRTIDGWTLTVSEDGGGCFLTRQYKGDGATTLMLGLDTDGTNHLSVLNDNWSITPQQRLKLNFRLSKGGYAQQLAIGMVATGQKGFVTTFEKKFPDYFATSEALYISKGDVPVAQLSLTGSGAAVAELRRCVDAHRGVAKPAAAAATNAGHIPKDPFAPASSKRAKR